MDKLNVHDTPTTILDQLASYNTKSVDNYIHVLKTELKDQQLLNAVLKEEDFQQNIDSVNNFVERNEKTIDHQLLELQEVVVQVKEVVDENKRLQETGEQFSELLCSEKCNCVAQKLRTLKNIKKDIGTFLDQHGIVVPNI